MRARRCGCNARLVTMRADETRRIAQALNAVLTSPAQLPDPVPLSDDEGGVAMLLEVFPLPRRAWDLPFAPRAIITARIGALSDRRCAWCNGRNIESADPQPVRKDRLPSRIATCADRHSVGRLIATMNMIRIGRSYPLWGMRPFMRERKGRTWQSTATDDRLERDPRSGRRHCTPAYPSTPSASRIRVNSVSTISVDVIRNISRNSVISRDEGP